jgi:hypothetical protein
MKVFLIWFLVIGLFISSCQQSPTETVASKAIESKLQSLLDDGEYFDLKISLEKYSEGLSRQKRKYFSAFIENAFNRNASSINIVNDLQRDLHIDLNDSSKAQLLLLQQDNYIKTFKYREAGETGKQVLQKYKKILSQNKLADIQNKTLIYAGSSDILPQKVFLKKNMVIPWKKDKAGLMTVPITSARQKHDFVFDTRAGISVIMMSYAKKLGIRMLGVNYEEGSGTTGKMFQAELGVADSIDVGDIRVHNVLFHVLPDEILSFPSMGYAIHGIIGFPVITALKEVQINQNGNMTIPLHPTEKTSGNLMFDESAIVLRLRTDDDTLSFYFDSGANSSHLFSNYFNRYESQIKKITQPDTVELGGVGGTERKQVYHLPSFTLYAGDGKANFRNLEVLTSPNYPGQKYFGNLGQDLMSQFEETTLNFEHMSIDFKMK